MKQRIGALSEGQKALVSLACLVLLEPTILLVDEVCTHYSLFATYQADHLSVVL